MIFRAGTMFCCCKTLQTVQVDHTSKAILMDILIYYGYMAINGYFLSYKFDVYIYFIFFKGIFLHSYFLKFFSVYYITYCETL